MKIIEKIHSYFSKYSTPPLNQKNISNGGYIGGFGSTLPSWLSLTNRDDKLKAYFSTPELAAIINYISDLFPNVNDQLFDLDGNEIDQDPILEKLNNPNFLQTRAEFMTQYSIFLLLYGTDVMFSQIPTGFDKQIQNWQLWHAPMSCTKAEIDNDTALFTKTKMDEYVKKLWIEVNTWKYEISEGQYVIANQHSVDIKTDGYLFGRSNIDGLQFPISNLQSNYETDNVLTRKYGSIGIFSKENQSVDAAMSVDEGEEEKLRVKFENEYGLALKDKQFIFTTVPLKFTPIALPIKDLMLSERRKENTRPIANAYKFQMAILYSDESKYDNLFEADKIIYRKILIPMWNQYYELMNSLLKTKEQGKVLKPSWSHIEELKQDQKLNSQVNSLNSRSVGEVQIALSNGSISKEAAKNRLMIVLGYSEDDAEKLLK